MSNSTPAESRSTACGPTLPATLTARAVPMVGADACWWPQPWNWLARMLKLDVASRAFSKSWSPGWRMHFPVRRRRASWPMVLSLQVPPEFSSVSLRGCEWSAKRHRQGSHVCHPDDLCGDRPPALGLSVRGHQSGRYGVSASLLPRTALPGHRAAACSVRQKAHTSTVRPDRSYFDFPWWTELRALLCWPWARLGKHVGRRISTRDALHRPVSLAAARGEAVSHHVRRSGACIRRRGRVGGGARPVGKRASAAACGRGSLRIRGVQRLDETLRPF